MGEEQLLMALGTHPTHGDMAFRHAGGRQYLPVALPEIQLVFTPGFFLYKIFRTQVGQGQKLRATGSSTS